MAGLLDRISRVFGTGKDNSQPPADPRTLFEDYFAEQTELLQKVRRGAAGVASSRKLLAQQLTKLAAEMDSLTLAARRSLDQGRDDLAREALLRKQQLARQLAELEAEHAQLQLEEERLVLISTRLQAKLDTIRARHASQWATYSAAEARLRVEEALDGISADVGNADEAVQLAAVRTRASQASLAASDALLGPGQAAPEAKTEVDETQAGAELAALKAELAARGPVAADHGAYLQPGQRGPSQVQDSWDVEPPSGSDGQDTAGSR